MNKLLFFAIGLTSIFASGQDTIVKRNKDVVIAKVIEIRTDEIVYKKFDDQSGVNHSVRKNQLVEINYADGHQDDFSSFGNTVATANPGRSLPDTKAYVLKTINEYAYERGSDTRRIQASFEGELLRLVVLNKKGKPVDEGEIYDFSSATKFRGIDRRGDNIGIFNIWVSIVTDVAKMRKHEDKLVLELRDQEAAGQLRLALMHLRDLQRDAKSKVEKF